MSERKIKVVDRATSDVNADRVEDQFCQLDIGKVQGLETPVVSR